MGTFIDPTTQGTALVTNDPAAIAAAESVKAQIQAAYTVALNRPRNMDQARTRILANCRRPGFAERVEYNKPIGKGIKGPSIRLAELALREWGNVRIETQVIFEDDLTRRTKVTVLDLESNSCYSKEIQLDKTIERKDKKGREVVSERVNSWGKPVYIVKATDDELHNKEAALVSKAVRNEGLRLIPSDIIDEALETARETLKKRDAEDPDAARKRMIDKFTEIGVEPKDLEGFLGHPTRQMNPSELEELRGIYRAIHDGAAKWSDYLEKENDGDSGKTERKTKASADELKDRLKTAKAPKKDKAEPPTETSAEDPHGYGFELSQIKEMGSKEQLAAAEQALAAKDVDEFFKIHAAVTAVAA